MKNTRRILSFLMAVIIVLSASPITAYATGGNVGTAPVISAKSVNGFPGSTVDVDVVIENNPGILGATLSLSYDSGLTLIDAKAGDAFSVLTMTKPGKFVSPCKFIWDGQELPGGGIKDGIILTLSFQISAAMKAGTDLSVNVTYAAGDIVDGNLQPVNVSMVNGAVTVIDYTPGDLNGDKNVNTTDVILLRRYIVGGYNTSINEAAADVNNDGKINATDVILIRRFIVGGYNVTLYPSSPRCNHAMVATNHKAATCTENGNIAYWHCTTCGKYFSDASGTTEVALDNTILATPGHTVVTDTAVAPTTTSTGLTQGSHCSVCNKVLVQQNIIPALTQTQHSIMYDVANGESYLAGKTIVNDNPTSFIAEDSFALKNLAEPGYRFLGWFDGAGANAIQIKRIEKGTAEDMQLYAHWEKITYTVQLKSSVFINEKELSYTVDAGANLPTPKLSNYVFTGWTDENGKLYNSTRISAGMTGNIVLTANWTSERNKAYTKTTLDKPIIVEDERSNTLLFAYEIGEIQNVPLYTIHNFGYISGDGVTKTETTTYSTTISKSLMDSYAKSVANSTTSSSDWSLSNGWSESTHVDSQWCKENGYSEEEAVTKSASDTSTWNVSSGTSGSTATTVVDSTQNELTSQAKINNTTTDSSKVSESHKHSESLTAGLNTTLDIATSTTASVENTATISGKFKQGGAELGASNSLKSGLSTTVSTDLKIEASTEKVEYDETGTQKEIGHSAVNEKETTDSKGVTTQHSNTATNNSGWHSDSSYGSSNTNSVEKSSAVTLTQKVNETYGYGKEIVDEINKTSSQGLASTNASTDEYSSSVGYATTTSKEVTSTWTTQSTKPGYHRWVVAGTAHVFAVVGYNLSSKNYFVYTYSIMDDETHEFEDYSNTTAAFNDNENGVIPFEIPTYVCEYVANRVSSTYGLKVDMATGIITDYTGNYSCVVIPEYMSIGKGDVVKITGISENAFKGNTTVKTVILSDFITEIPRGAFAGCTSLLGIGGNSITKIGQEAFAGCTSFVEAEVSGAVIHLGENAFKGVEKLTVNAANAELVEAAVNSGAKRITLNLDLLGNDTSALSGKTLTVPSGTEYFEFNGSGKTFADLAVVSNATKTVINKANFVGSGSIPLCISSPQAILNQTTIKASGIALALLANSVNLGLQGTITVNSDNANAILCKNVTLYESNTMAVGKLTIPNSNNKMIICGTIEGRDYLGATEKQIEHVDETTFNNMLSTYTLHFDANGGSCLEANRNVSNSTPIGELPIPTRDHYSFAGWYLADGTQVTAATVFSTGLDQTVSAHWTPLTFAVNLNANGGVCNETLKTATYNEPIGVLPVPTRDYHTFGGWYTEATGGTEVTALTSFPSTNDLTIYARWTENPISDWVQASNAPADSMIINNKWTYAQRTNTESSDESMPGYTQYDSYWVQSGSGTANYAAIPNGFDNGYTGFNVSCPYSATENNTYKRTVSANWAGYVYWHWMYAMANNTQYDTEVYGLQRAFSLEPVNANYNYSIFNYAISTVDCPIAPNTGYCYNDITCAGYDCYDILGSWRVNDGQRRFYRFDYYVANYIDYYKMFKYYKTEAKESPTVVTATDMISDVQAWVQYRAK